VTHSANPTRPPGHRIGRKIPPPSTALTPPPRLPELLDVPQIRVTDSPPVGPLNNSKVNASESCRDPTKLLSVDDSRDVSASSSPYFFEGNTPEDLTGKISTEKLYPINGGGFADIYVGTLECGEKRIKVALQLAFVINFTDQHGDRQVGIKVIRSHTLGSKDGSKIAKVCVVCHTVFMNYRFQSQRLRREVSIWSCLQHPNIIPLLGTTTSFGKYMAMVCPWMEDGNLGEYLKRGNALSMHDRYSIVSKPAGIRGDII